MNYIHAEEALLDLRLTLSTESCTTLCQFGDELLSSLFLFLILNKRHFFILKTFFMSEEVDFRREKRDSSNYRTSMLLPSAHPAVLFYFTFPE